MGFFRPFYDLMFWFDTRPVSFTPWANALLLWGMLAVLLAGIGVRVWLKKQTMDKMARRVYRRLSALLITAGLIGLLLYWLTWAAVPVLSMRFFYLVWLFSFALWGYFIWRYAAHELPALQAKWAEKEAYEKWLPKPRKK